MTLPFHSGADAGPVGSRVAIDTLVQLMEIAFDADIKHSIMVNLRDLREEDWTALVPGGGRSIADILEHVAWTKWMYLDYSFGSATLRGDQPPMVPPGGARFRPPDQLLAWLTEGHHRLLASARALADDTQLERPRLTYWGQSLPTRTIIQIIIAHDYYHAGEINHLRALLQGNDRPS